MSSSIPKIILITGEPGVGKTTLLRKLYEKISANTSQDLKGFYTEELRDGSHMRIGFDVIDFKDNRRAPLARSTSTSCQKSPKVGKYSVDLNSFEKIALPIIKNLNQNTIYFIDEIGKMESFSKEFERSILNMMLKINTDNFFLVATVPLRNLTLSDKIKAHPLAKIFTITFQNRNTIFEDINNLVEQNFCT